MAPTDLQTHASPLAPLEGKSRGILVAWTVAFGVCVWLGAAVGRSLVIEGDLAPFWPVTGIALTAFLLLPWRWWAWMSLVVLTAVFVQFAPTSGVRVAMGVANVVEPMAMAAVLRFVGFDARLVGVRDAVSLVTVGFFGTLANTMAQVGLHGWLVPVPVDWGLYLRSFWIGNFTGLLLVAPLVLAWTTGATGPRSAREWWEFAATSVAAVTLSWLVFREPSGTQLRLGALSYLALPPVVWAALRLGWRGATPVLLATALIAVYATAAGFGPFATGEPAWRVAQLQSFIGVAAISVGLIVSLQSERDRANAALAQRTAELRGHVRDLQATEARLQAVNQRLALSLDVAHMVAWTWDVGSDRLECTGDLDAALGLKRGTFDGTFAGFVALLEPNDRARVLAVNAECVRGERSGFAIELCVRPPGAEPRWMECCSRTFRDASGSAVRMVGTLADITERRQQEERRRAEAEQMGIIFGSLREAVYAIDTGGCVLYLTPSIEALTGWRVDEALGRPFLDFVLPEDRDIAAAEFAKAFVAPDDPTPAEFRLRRPDGSECWISASSRLLVRDEGPPLVTGVIADVSEARAARRALRESEDRMRAILEASVMAIVVVSTATGRIVYVNRRAEHLLGAEPGSLQEMPHDDPGWEIRGLDDRPLAPERLPYLLVLRSGGPVYDVRHRLRRRDGRWIAVAVNGAPLRDERGQVTGVVFSIADITAQLATEQEIRALNADLEIRVRERTAELQRIVNAMAGREVRMAELKAENERLRARLHEEAAT